MTCIRGNPLGSATFEPLSVAGALGIKDQGFLRFSGLVQIAVFVPHDSMTSVAGHFFDVMSLRTGNGKGLWGVSVVVSGTSPTPPSLALNSESPAAASQQVAKVCVPRLPHPHCSHLGHN